MSPVRLNVCAASTASLLKVLVTLTDVAVEKSSAAQLAALPRGRYSNVTVVIAPFEEALPFNVAVVGCTEVGGKVVTEGGNLTSGSPPVNELQTPLVTTKEAIDPSRRPSLRGSIAIAR